MERTSKRKHRHLNTTTPDLSQPSGKQRALAWVLLLGANLLWAGSYTAGKFALLDISVNLLNALRMIIAALCLVPLLVIRRRELHLTRKDIPQLALLALVGFVLNKMLEYGGLALTTASDVALLIASESIFTALFSWLLLRERFRWRTLLSLLLGLLGVYLIVERSLLPTIPSGGGATRLLGDLLVILALIFESFYTIRGKALLAKHPPLLVTSAAIVGSTLFWLPMAGVSILTTGWPTLSWQAWLGILWLALMSTVVAYLAMFQALKYATGTAAASALFVQPLLGTLLAVVLLGDQLVPTTVIGGLLILCSVSLLARA